MKKKIFTALVLVVILTRGIFAQQSERLTYQEMKPDGTYAGRAVTVEAIFIAWIQEETFMEGNYQVTYQCFRPYNGEWSDWEFIGRRPAIFLTLSQYYYSIMQYYSLYPKAGMKYGKDSIKQWAIPDGHPSPIWWGKDGQSIFTFYKKYLIKT